MDDDKAPPGPINLGVACSAVLLTAVLVSEQQEFAAIPEKGLSYHIPGNTDGIGPHLDDYRMPSHDVSVQLAGIPMTASVGTVVPTVFA